MSLPRHSTRPRRTLLLVVGGVVLALVLGLGVWWQLRPDEALALEPAAAAGQDPFLDAAATSPVAEFTEVVSSRVIESTSALAQDPDTGGRAATGDTAGLYGGSTSNSVCDVAALARFLSANTAHAAAWAAVRGIDVADIEDQLRATVAVHLTADTLVINHGFDGTKATPRTAVLQAGTAVLVDRHGLPVVRCSCGNPLLPAGAVDLATAPRSGDAWSGYDTTRVVRVSASGEVLPTLTVIDTQTAELAPIDIRSSVGAVLLATSAGQSGDRAGAVHLSQDGVTWTTVLDSSPLYGVDTGAGLAVAVGAATGEGGAVYTSADGATWSEPIEVIDPLVAVAYGDGTWIAVGNRSFAEEGGEGDGSSGAIYRSTDARAWERVATTDPYENSELAAAGGFVWQSMQSVGYGAGLWVATAVECDTAGCRPVQFTSEDGRSWTRHGLERDLTRMDVDHDGSQWGFVGGELAQTQRNDELGLAGTSADAGSWAIGETEPDRVLLTGLDAGPDGWYAVDASRTGPQGASTPGEAVYRSTNLTTWTRLGVVTEGVTAVAVLEGAAPVVRTATTTPTSSTTSAAAVDYGDVTQVRILTRGLMFMTGDSPPEFLYADSAGPAIEALTSVLGEPTRTPVAGDGTCQAEGTNVAWGGFSIFHEGSEPSADWFVRLKGTSADLPDVPVGTAGEVTLGVGSDEVANQFPGVSHESYRYQGKTYDIFQLDTSDGRGTEVSAIDGVVESISAPLHLQGQC